MVLLGGRAMSFNHSKKNSSLYSALEENHMFHMMLDSRYEGIVYVDESGIIRYVNQAFADYNKMSIKEIIGRPHGEIVHDPNIDRLLSIRNFFEPLVFVDINGRKFVASRRPVYRRKQFAGIFCQYFSISPQDVAKKFGPGYIDLIASLETKNIMDNVSQTLLELDTYKDEFQKANIAKRGIKHIIGNSAIMKDLKNKLLCISESNSSVLLTGESGTGKELFAQAIHSHSLRSSGPFIKINCAAIPENLLESELFGYVEGAFTGARKGGKMGKFELANQGTIFMDEIGDMPLSMQAKLLRVLQEKEIERLGAEKTISVDVRIISATNKDLCDLVREGAFREDLYYRINVINFHIPPLRDRKEDIPELVNYAIKELNKNMNRSILKISEEALQLLINYDWPGNIRELKNVLESAMNFCRSHIIDQNALPYFLHLNGSNNKKTDKIDLQGKIDEVEKQQLIAVLNQCQGCRKDAAAILRISKSTLYRLMKKHNLLDK
jgi:transcriptional regulator with PAS, ATPase and Fis domain